MRCRSCLMMLEPEVGGPPKSATPVASKLRLHSVCKLAVQVRQAHSLCKFSVPTLLSLPVGVNEGAPIFVGVGFVRVCAVYFLGVIKPAASRLVCGNDPGNDWKERYRNDGRWACWRRWPCRALALGRVPLRSTAHPPSTSRPPFDFPSSLPGSANDTQDVRFLFQYLFLHFTPAPPIP